MIAAVGVCNGRLNRLFKACISTFSMSSSSPLLSIQASALFRRQAMFFFSCISRRTAVSILYNASLEAIELIIAVFDCMFVLRVRMFSFFFTSLVMVFVLVSFLDDHVTCFPFLTAFLMFSNSHYLAFCLPPFFLMFNCKFVYYL